MKRFTLMVMVLATMLLLSSSSSYAQSVEESVFNFHSVLILDKNLQPYKEEKINGLISFVNKDGKKFVIIKEGGATTNVMYIAEKSGWKKQGNDHLYSYVLFEVTGSQYIPMQLFEIYDDKHGINPKELFLVIQDPSDYSTKGGVSYRNIYRLK